MFLDTKIAMNNANTRLTHDNMEMRMNDELEFQVIFRDQDLLDRLNQVSRGGFKVPSDRTIPC